MATLNRTTLEQLSRGVCATRTPQAVQVVVAQQEEQSVCCPPATECFPIDTRKLAPEACESISLEYFNESPDPQRVYLGTPLAQEGAYARYGQAPSAADSPQVFDCLEGGPNVCPPAQIIGEMPVGPVIINAPQMACTPNVMRTQGLSELFDLKPVLAGNFRLENTTVNASGQRIGSRNASLRAFQLDRTGEVCGRSLREVCPPCPTGADDARYTVTYGGAIVPLGQLDGVYFTLPPAIYTFGNPEDPTEVTQIQATSARLDFDITAEGCNSYAPCEC